MHETVKLIVSVVTTLGLGGVCGAVVQHFVERRKQARTQQFEFKQRRYGAIVIAMIARVGPAEDLPKLTAVRADLQTMADVGRELDVELLNAFLFASDSVIERLSEFNRQPSRHTLVLVADAMRRDLYGESTRLPKEALEVICGLGKREE